MPARISAFVLLSAAVLTAAAASSQARAGAAAETTAVPRELVGALFRGLWPEPPLDAPTVTVGRLPDEIPSAVVPVGATVLGGLAPPATVRSPGRLSTAVVLVPRSADEALAVSERQVESAGWRRAAATGSRGGFVSGPATRTNTFCRESGALSVWTAPRPAGGSYLWITLHDGARYTACGLDMALAGRNAMNPFGDVPIPTLEAPKGAVTVSGGSMGGGPDARAASTRLDVALTPAALVAHYAAQLRTDGWMLGASLSGDGMAVEPAEKRDAKGRAWQGLLSAIALPGTCERDVVFRVAAVASRGR